MTNREVANKLFDYIRKNSKFNPYDIEYGDTYFVFTGDPDSVIHFRVKGVSKQWKFGMWVHAEFLGDSEHSEDPVIQFFAQWEKDIDKFKPSRSDICVSVTAQRFAEDINDEGWMFYDIMHALDMMRNHPILCYCGICGEDGFGYTSIKSFTWYFIKGEFYHFKKAVSKAFMTAIFLPICKFKVWRANRHKCVELCEIYNFEKRNPGWSTSHDYCIECNFKESATDEEMYKVARIFKKQEYGKYGCFQSVAEINCYTQTGHDGCFGFSFDKDGK